MKIAPDSFAFTILLGLFAALPALSIDISAPTLALLPQALETSQTTAGLTLSLFMVGFAMGQLAGGNRSDGHGRRPVLLGGLACFTVAGIACALSITGEMLTLCRFIQGFGAGACSVTAFAMIQDLFQGEAARTKRSYVTVIFGIAPIIAPAVGAVLTDVFGWRSVHAALAFAGLALLAVTGARVAESRPPLASPRLAGTSDMAPLGQDSVFLRLTLTNAFSYAVIFTYISGSPIVIMGQMGRSSGVFAAVFTCTAMALAAGAWVNGRLTRRGMAAAALIGTGMSGAMAATLALACVSVSGIIAATILLPLLLVILFTRGIIAPNLQHLAIERQRDRAGLASAVVGVSQLLMGAAASAAVAFLLPIFGPAIIALLMAALALAALVCWIGAAKRIAMDQSFLSPASSE